MKVLNTKKLLSLISAIDKIRKNHIRIDTATSREDIFLFWIMEIMIMKTILMKIWMILLKNFMLKNKPTICELATINK